MGANLLGELVANNGTYFLYYGMAEERGNIDQIIVRGDGIQDIGIFVHDDIEGRRNVTNDYLSATILPNGLRITPKNDDVFVAVEIYAKTGDNPCGLELVFA
jgi:hypothetical protein